MSNEKNPKEYRRALQENTNAPGWFPTVNGVEVTAIETDYAACTADITARSMDPSGCVHKGLLCTLMDNAAAMAAVGSGRDAVTLNGENHYHLPVSEPCTLTSEARLVSEQSQIRVYHTAVRRDDTLIASGIYTFFMLKEKY